MVSMPSMLHVQYTTIMCIKKHYVILWLYYIVSESECSNDYIILVYTYILVKKFSVYTFSKVYTCKKALCYCEW